MFAIAMTFLCVYLVVVFSLLVSMAVIQAQFISRLRRYVPTVWAELGCPAVLVGLTGGYGSSQSWAAATRLNQYFSRGRYSSLQDVAARNLASRVASLRRAVLWFGIAGGALVAVVMLVGRHYDV